VKLSISICIITQTSQVAPWRTFQFGSKCVKQLQLRT